MADVDTIKEAFRSSTTFDQIDAEARLHTRDVKALQASDDEHDKTMAIQIRNLLIYRRAQLRAAEEYHRHYPPMRELPIR